MTGRSIRKENLQYCIAFFYYANWQNQTTNFPKGSISQIRLSFLCFHRTQSVRTTTDESSCVFQPEVSSCSRRSDWWMSHSSVSTGQLPVCQSLTLITKRMGFKVGIMTHLLQNEKMGGNWHKNIHIVNQDSIRGVTQKPFAFCKNNFTKCL